MLKREIFNIFSYEDENIGRFSNLRYLYENCNFKSRETFKNKYHLDNKWHFQWMQLIHTISLIWKQKINDDNEKMLKKIMSYKTLT